MIFIKKYFNISFIFLIIITIFISIFFIPLTATDGNISILPFIENGSILWPAPEHYRINSYYGKRNAPTAGASTYHKGIDIGAPENSKLVAVTNGTITYVGFLGGGGYTITITDENTKNGEIRYSYCHCKSPFIVSKGDYVKKGQIIGYVGPKYVYGIIGNQYKDSNGIPTNGATTGPHLHFGMRINGKYVDPLNYLPVTSQP